MAHTVITIARQYGSGGKTVGRMLSEDLGIHFYNREILRLASDASGISEEIFGENDEKIKKIVSNNGMCWSFSASWNAKCTCR